MRPCAHAQAEELERPRSASACADHDTVRAEPSKVRGQQLLSAASIVGKLARRTTLKEVLLLLLLASRQRRLIFDMSLQY